MNNPEFCRLGGPTPSARERLLWLLEGSESAANFLRLSSSSSSSLSIDIIGLKFIEPRDLLIIIAVKDPEWFLLSIGLPSGRRLKLPKGDEGAGAGGGKSEGPSIGGPDIGEAPTNVVALDIVVNPSDPTARGICDLASCFPGSKSSSYHSSNNEVFGGVSNDPMPKSGLESCNMASSGSTLNVVSDFRLDACNSLISRSNDGITGKELVLAILSSSDDEEESSSPSSVRVASKSSAPKEELRDFLISFFFFFFFFFAFFSLSFFDFFLSFVSLSSPNIGRGPELARVSFFCDLFGDNGGNLLSSTA